MTLIKCPVCEKEISDRAKICPHCGQIIMDESTSYESQLRIVDDSGRQNTVAFIIGCVLEVFALIIFFSFNREYIDSRIEFGSDYNTYTYQCFVYISTALRYGLTGILIGIGTLLQRSKAASYLVNGNIKAKNKLESRMEFMIGEKKKEEALNRKHKKLLYWEEHPAQKAEIESKIQQLEDERRPVNDEIKRKELQIQQIKKSVYEADTPLLEIDRKMKAEIERLTEQMNALGHLKLKEKKELKESIDTLRGQLPSFTEFEEERNVMLEKLQPQIDAITIEINELRKESEQYSKQIVDLQNELDVDR